MALPGALALALTLTWRRALGPALSLSLLVGSVLTLARAGLLITAWSLALRLGVAVGRLLALSLGRFAFPRLIALTLWRLAILGRRRARALISTQARLRSDIVGARTLRLWPSLVFGSLGFGFRRAAFGCAIVRGLRVRGAAFGRAIIGSLGFGRFLFDARGPLLGVALLRRIFAARCGWIGLGRRLAVALSGVILLAGLTIRLVGARVRVGVTARRLLAGLVLWRRAGRLALLRRLFARLMAISRPVGVSARLVRTGAGLLVGALLFGTWCLIAGLPRR